MVGVTKEGTAAGPFRGVSYSVASKTGTAQVFSLKNQKYSAHSIAEDRRDHALFEAFAPAEHPRIALALIVENGGFGAEAAAPIARKLLDAYLLGYPQQNKNNESNSASNSAVKNSLQKKSNLSAKP